MIDLTKLPTQQGFERAKEILKDKNSTKEEKEIACSILMSQKGVTEYKPNESLIVDKG